MAIGEKDSIQPNTREEVFRYTLTLHSLLENPPGDFPDNLREDLTKGFVSIFRHVRYTLTFCVNSVYIWVESDYTFTLTFLL